MHKLWPHSLQKQQQPKVSNPTTKSIESESTNNENISTKDTEISACGEPKKSETNLDGKTPLCLINELVRFNKVINFNNGIILH